MIPTTPPCHRLYLMPWPPCLLDADWCAIMTIFFGNHLQVFLAWLYCTVFVPGYTLFWVTVLGSINVLLGMPFCVVVCQPEFLR